MEKKKFRCRHCGRLLPVRVRGQAYCGDKACQKARNNAWRREKYASDPDYRLNQKDSTDAWLSSVGGAAKYHREYRKKKKRIAMRKEPGEIGAASLLKSSLMESLFADTWRGFDASANSNAKNPETPIKTGRYRILPEGANSNAFWAEIQVITDG